MHRDPAAVRLLLFSLELRRARGHREPEGLRHPTAVQGRAGDALDLGRRAEDDR